MTDILRETRTHEKVIDVFRSYTPDWSKNTMNTVNELTSQFYGWLPDTPTPPSGDWVVYSLLSLIVLILVFKR